MDGHSAPTEDKAIGWSTWQYTTRYHRVMGWRKRSGIYASASTYSVQWACGNLSGSVGFARADEPPKHLTPCARCFPETR